MPSFRLELLLHDGDARTAEGGQKWQLALDLLSTMAEPSRYKRQQLQCDDKHLLSDMGGNVQWTCSARWPEPIRLAQPTTMTKVEAHAIRYSATMHAREYVQALSGQMLSTTPSAEWRQTP